jgi:hypothetical protein
MKNPPLGGLATVLFDENGYLIFAHESLTQPAPKAIETIIQMKN